MNSRRDILGLPGLAVGGSGEKGAAAWFNALACIWLVGLGRG